MSTRKGKSMVRGVKEICSFQITTVRCHDLHPFQTCPRWEDNASNHPIRMSIFRILLNNGTASVYGSWSHINWKPPMYLAYTVQSGWFMWSQIADLTSTTRCGAWVLINLPHKKNDMKWWWKPYPGSNHSDIEIVRRWSQGHSNFATKITMNLHTSPTALNV